MRLNFLLLVVIFTPAVNADVLFLPDKDSAAVVDGGLSRGVAFGDADNDGDPDLLVANTINYPEFLYRNDHGRFIQVMETAPSLAGGFTEGVSWIDFDNDGDLDIFAVRTNSTNSLYRNDGNWSFSEAEGGDLTASQATSSMACWADLDADGWLDVFVVNRNGESDALYRNRAGQSFERVQNPGGIRSDGDGRACVLADLDGNGFADIVVGNFINSHTTPPTKHRNFMYLNRGQFQFEEQTQGHLVESRNLTYGLSAADADNDGHLDLFVTNIGRGEHSELYLNDGQGRFQRHDAGIVSPVDTPSKGHSWGDYDLDGDLDLAIANGTEGTKHIQNELYLNDGAANFTAWTDGAFVTDAHVSAGIAWADSDQDGDLDLFVANWGGGDEDNAWYRNQSQGNWLKLRLKGDPSNRMGVGTRVTITAVHQGQSHRQTRWLSTSTGYASQNEPVIHFGLGDATHIAQLHILWPSGQSDLYQNLTANQHLHATEGVTLEEI